MSSQSRHLTAKFPVSNSFKLHSIHRKEHFVTTSLKVLPPALIIKQANVKTAGQKTEKVFISDSFKATSILLPVPQRTHSHHFHQSSLIDAKPTNIKQIGYATEKNRFRFRTLWFVMKICSWGVRSGIEVIWIEYETKKKTFLFEYPTGWTLQFKVQLDYATKLTL